MPEKSLKKGEWLILDLDEDAKLKIFSKRVFDNKIIIISLKETFPHPF